MARFHHDHQGLADELRRSRPQPPHALEDFVTAYLARAPRRRRVPLRALAVALLAVGMLGGVGTTVGVGHAAAGPTALVSAVVHVIEASAAPAARPATGGGGANAQTATRPTTSTTPHGRENDDDDDPSDDQYKPGKGCGDKNHVHARVNECK